MIANVEFSTGHGERYFFPSRIQARGFLYALTNEFQETHWYSPQRLAFGFGCQSLATLHETLGQLPSITMPSASFVTIASHFGGELM